MTSTSNTTDFQSRRLDIRYRPGRPPAHVHTLNGTAVTWRHMIALLENATGVDVPDGAPAVGCAGAAAGRRRVMERETPITPEDPDIPDEPPPPDDGEPEIDDQPLGPPADLDEDDAPLPGLPESEPPAGRLARPPTIRPGFFVPR